jgi:hypothetical protein
MSENNTAEMIGNAFITDAERDRGGASANVVDGLFAIARGLSAVAEAVHALHQGHTSPSMAEVERFTQELKEGVQSLDQTLQEGLGILCSVAQKR